MPRLRSLATLAFALMLLAPLGAPITPALAAGITCPPAPAGAVEATPPPVSPTETAFPEGDIELTVFAAASLTDAYAEIADAIAAEHPNITIHIETAGSQTLVTQLTEGAEADVLATANMSTMQQAQDSDLIDGEPVTFTANRLVIVTPEDDPGNIDGIDGLADDGIRLVIATEDVPAGTYARQAICAWADDDADAIAAIGDNVVSEEIDVRSVLTKVQLGEADAGIVYASDAAAASIAGTPVRVVEFPDGVPTAAAYPIAPVTGGDTEAARAFIAFVMSDQGQAILEEFGFTPVS